jgi:hypothetical protein
VELDGLVCFSADQTTCLRTVEACDTKGLACVGCVTKPNFYSAGNSCFRAKRWRVSRCQFVRFAAAWAKPEALIVERVGIVKNDWRSWNICSGSHVERELVLDVAQSKGACHRWGQVPLGSRRGAVR